MNSLPDNWHHHLSELRMALLKLHKSLLDNERLRYEAEFGPITSNGQYLQLLINHEWFQWLQPYTKLVVGIDETLDSKEPVILEQVDGLWEQARVLTLEQINKTDSMYALAHVASDAVQDQHAIVIGILNEASERSARSPE